LFVPTQSANDRSEVLSEFLVLEAAAGVDPR
jgi:hypothetical protein